MNSLTAEVSAARKAALGFIAVAILFASALIVMITHATGCTADQAAAVQKGAENVGYAAGGPVPTSQPSNTLTIVHDVAAGTATVVPAAAPIEGLVIGIAGLVGSVAGAFVHKYATNGSWLSVASEIATAATGFEPGPWTPATQAVLQQAGLHDIAAPGPTPSPAATALIPPATGAAAKVA